VEWRFPGRLRENMKSNTSKATTRSLSTSIKVAIQVKCLRGVAAMQQSDKTNIMTGDDGKFVICRTSTAQSSSPLEQITVN
jgi:hypothetical protein